MNRNYVLANCVLWASAIVASAMLGAPSSLTLVLLPSLATISWLASMKGAARRKCGMFF